MVRSLMSAPPTDRVGRYPKHPFLVNGGCFTATPMCIARVLPGETLENLFMESRVVTDPILNPIIGWKKEYYFFYVKMTDLMIDAVKNLFIDPNNAEITNDVAAANHQINYTAKGGIEWMRLACDRVVSTYFRDDGETAASRTWADGRRIVQIREQLWMDSLTDKDDMPEGAAIAGATDAGDLDRLMDAFNNLRALSIMDMTYEDFLRSYGISIPQKDENKPEMLAHFSDFQYPSNTIDPVSGTPSSAVSWVFKNGERKRRLFKEPGFIIGLSVTRPKVYFGGLAGSALGFAKRAWDWMPNYTMDMPETALKNFALNTGPVGDRTAGTVWDSYFVDMRDELLYGDQYQNVRAFTATLADNFANHMLALPDATGNRKYPTETQCKGFFKTPASAFNVKQDGYVSLSIKGLQVDYTVGNFAEV